MLSVSVKGRIWNNYVRCSKIYLLLQLVMCVVRKIPSAKIKYTIFITLFATIPKNLISFRLNMPIMVWTRTILQI